MPSSFGKKVSKSDAKILLFAWFLLTVLATASGPFGTYHTFSFPARFLYWAVAVFLALVLGALIRRLVQRFAAHLDVMLQMLIISVLCAVFVGFSLYLLTIQFSNLTSSEIPPGYSFPLAVFVISLCLSVLAVYLKGRPDLLAAVEEVDECDGQSLPRLMLRLGPDLLAPLIRLSVNDHYVEVHTEKGTASLLMRFSDAMAELDGADGLQVHRSHWVAMRAIEKFETRRNRLYLHLKDGSEVPVSATYRPAVEAAMPDSGQDSDQDRG